VKKAGESRGDRAGLWVRICRGGEIEEKSGYSGDGDILGVPPEPEISLESWTSRERHQKGSKKTKKEYFKYQGGYFRIVETEKIWGGGEGRRKSGKIVSTL